MKSAHKVIAGLMLGNLVSSCGRVDFVEARSDMTPDRLKSYSDYLKDGTQSFDYVIGLSLILDNNREDAGRSIALSKAAKLCGLPRRPSAEEVNLTQGFTGYDSRDYFVRCPVPEKDMK